VPRLHVEWTGFGPYFVNNGHGYGGQWYETSPYGDQYQAPHWHPDGSGPGGRHLYGPSPGSGDGSDFDATKENNMKKSDSPHPEHGERAVVVTTEHRGVFFGYAEVTEGSTIKLRRGRLCVYWSSDMRGFMGLANPGPSEACRIGPAADIEVRHVTCVVEAVPDAVRRWEAAPWAP